MSFQLQTPEESAAAKAELAKLETAAQAARAALNEFETAQSSIPPQYRRDSDGRGARLKSEVTTTQKALVAAQNVQHNANVYRSVLDDIQAKMAANAAEKAAQEAQAANESEAQFKIRAQSAYVAAGGTALGFASEWPILRSELVRQKTLTALSQPQPTSYLDEYIQRRNGG